VINGVHAIIYSSDAEADRDFLQKMFRLRGVDAGEGWLIFGLPPAELGVHPAHDGDGGHELYFMTDDVEGLIEDLAARGGACEPIRDQGWGRLTAIKLPSGGSFSIYEPRHARPEPMGAAAAKRKAPARSKAKPRTAKRPAAKAKKKKRR
jgi:hypothetical protein